MLWSIDSCQNRYPLTSVTWLYRGLKCTTHWGEVFIKVLRWPVMVLKWVQAQKTLLQNDFLKVPSRASLLALAKSTYNNLFLYITNTSVIHLWFWCCIQQNFWLYSQESPQGHRHNVDTFLLWKVFLVPKMENFIQSIPITWTTLYNEQFL